MHDPLSSFRGRWDLLWTLHPLFLAAESFPTIENVDEGYYNLEGEYDINNLKDQITTLRNDFNLNIIKQQQIDIDQLIEESPTLVGLESDLQTLLEELEKLVDPHVLDLETLKVSSSFKSS